MLRVLAHPLAGSPEREHRLQELFCKAAQAGAAEGPGEAAHAQVTLGRGGSSTLQLGSGDCTLVSRKHAKLRLEWPESEPASSGASAGSLQPRLHILSVGTNGACVFHEAVAAEEGFNWRCLRRPSVLIDIPKGVWCPIYDGDCVVLGWNKTMAEEAAAGEAGAADLAKCRVIRFRELEDLHAWAAQQAQQRQQAQQWLQQQAQAEQERERQQQQRELQPSSESEDFAEAGGLTARTSPHQQRQQQGSGPPSVPLRAGKRPPGGAAPASHGASPQPKRSRREQLALVQAVAGQLDPDLQRQLGQVVSQASLGRPAASTSSSASGDAALQLPGERHESAGSEGSSPLPVGGAARGPAGAARRAAATAGAAEWLEPQQQPLEPVADVAAELQRLGVEYTGSDPACSIQLAITAETREHLQRLVRLDPGMPCFGDASISAQWGLRRLLVGGARPAQLCRRPGALVGDRLTLRATRAMGKDTACGWLSGRLVEANGRKPDSFTPHEFYMSAQSLDALALQNGAEYRGPDLILQMAEATNEWGFLQDTLFRAPSKMVCASQGSPAGRAVEPAEGEEEEEEEEEGPGEGGCDEEEAEAEEEEGEEAGNVKAFVTLIRDPASGLAIPLPVVYTTRPVQAEEELVCGWSELAEQNLLQESIASRLIASGWRCHVLDAFWLRLCDLAAAKRDALVTGGARVAAGRSLHAALQRAAALYYEQQGGDGGGAGDPGMAPRLAEALEASVREHPPPYCVAALSRVEQPPLEEQFRPLAAARELPPMARRSDFGALPPEVVASLDSAPEARPLDEDARRRLRAGDVPTAVVCDIQFRLHRVRLLTPPSGPARSLNARPDGDRPAAGDVVGAYVGRVLTAEQAERDQWESSYLYDMRRQEVGPTLHWRCPWRYRGPDLVVDASELRNELAFCNDIFGTVRPKKASLQTQVVWDQETKRPAVIMRYVLSCKAKPLQELVLDYGANYWPTAGRSLRRGHEAFAERAAQAIGVVYGALQWAGVDGAALAACLAPVDLEAAEHRRYRAFWP